MAFPAAIEALQVTISIIENKRSAKDILAVRIIQLRRNQIINATNLKPVDP